jgi:transketolase
MGIQADLGRTDLRRMSAAMRRWIIEQSFESNVGHIGSALSIVEIMAALWGSVLRDPATDAPHRDRFILAKGHAALALYCAMRWKKLISKDLFSTYCKDGSVLAAHPESALPGVEVATGSLGQGLSVGCGLALALLRKRSPARVFVLMSDAECNEGQVWEAAMFAAHHRLSNLTAIVDLNGLQAMGRTDRIVDMASMAAVWCSFGWDARDVDGHDARALVESLAGEARDGAGPTVVIARTTLGKGVAFMEDQVDWHYRNLSPALADEALCLLEETR